MLALLGVVRRGLLGAYLCSGRITLKTLVDPFKKFIVPVRCAGVVRRRGTIHRHTNVFSMSRVKRVFMDKPSTRGFIGRIFSGGVASIPSKGVLCKVLLCPGKAIMSSLLMCGRFRPSGCLLMIGTSGVTGSCR